jgi:hypothetical protein
VSDHNDAPNHSEFPKSSIPEQLKEVDEMVEILDDTLLTLYRRGLYEHSDGLGNQLDEGDYDRLKRAFDTAKKVKDLVRLMEENQLASEDRLAQAPHVPVSYEILASTATKAWLEDHGSLLGDDKRSLLAVITAVNKLRLPTSHPDKIDIPSMDDIRFKISEFENDHARAEYIYWLLTSVSPDKIAGQSGNAGVSMDRPTEEGFYFVTEGGKRKLRRLKNGRWWSMELRALDSHLRFEGPFVGPITEETFPTPDTSKIDAAVEALELAKNCLEMSKVSGMDQRNRNALAVMTAETALAALRSAR